MPAEKLPEQFPLPEDGEQPNTYQEWLKKLECTCVAGAKLKASTPQSATVDLGDIIPDITRELTTVTSAYKVIVVILQMITCIIDVLCALMNPFTLIPALIRLFGVCLPEFILILPQIGILAVIICILKIIMAIIEYIITVLLPPIQEIIDNILDLIAAMDSGNQDGIDAVAFKLAALIKQLYNAIGILEPLAIIWEMILALLEAGVGIPCLGSGGSCSGCGDDQCPSALQYYSITGSDGILTVVFGDDESFDLIFFSPSQASKFIQIEDFFPRGFDYNSVNGEDDVPYVMEIDGGSYAVTSADSSGVLNMTTIPNAFSSDGYLSDLVSPATDLSGTNFVRFGTDTDTFESADVGKYVEIKEHRSSAASDNNGTWRIGAVYDGFNVRLDRTPGDTWNAYNSYDPAPHITWRIAQTAPTAGSSQDFSLNINHAELIRHEVIGAGCHPAVKATIEGTANRFPNASNLTFPPLPDLDQLIIDLTNCVAAVAPIDVDSQYVIDNYQSIAINVVGLEDCVIGKLNDFNDELTDFVEDTYSRIFDPERTTLTADPTIQVVGNFVTASVIPYDVNDGYLSQTLPPGIIEVEIFSDDGYLSDTREVLDAYGNSTGEFIATVGSDIPTVINLTAKVADVYVSDFDGSNLVTREVPVTFVSREPKRSITIEGETPEPLGSATSK